MKRCIECKQVKSENEFSLNGVRCAQHRLRSRCSLCEQTKRDKVDIFIQKARDTRRRHAERLDIATAVLEAKYGWTLERLVHDAKHHWENGCVDCGIAFQKMPGMGLSELTLDITNPREPPYYGINTRWICNGCNRRKGRKSPDRYGAELQARHRRKPRLTEPDPQLLLAPDPHDWISTFQSTADDESGDLFGKD